MDSMFSNSNFCGFFNNNIYKNGKRLTRPQRIKRGLAMLA
jgi:hypothetical protein